MKYSVQLVGVGGQGVLLASAVLGNAAVAEGLDVAMSEVHGMAQRGGSVMSSVRIGNDVLSPLIPRGGADLLLGFEPIETFRSLNTVNRESFVITNTRPVYPINVSIGLERYPPIEELVGAIRKVTDNLVAMDANAKAVQAGKAITANSVLIGAMTAVRGFPLSRKRMLASLLEVVPAKAREVNAKAFELGYVEVAEICH